MGITSISALAALRMLIQALMSLAERIEDVPPTPPLEGEELLEQPASASVPPFAIDAPEATLKAKPEIQLNEGTNFIGEYSGYIAMEGAVIARGFFSKVPRPFSLAEYLLRLHKYCPHSPGVYLMAAPYC